MGAFVRELVRVVPPRSRADLLAAGLSPRTLGGDRWRQVTHGWHVPRGVADTGARHPVRLLLAPGGSHRHVPGARSVRAALEPEEVTHQHGLSLTTVLRTAEDLAREAPDLVEAVVALDVLMEAGLVRQRSLLAELGACAGGRGARQARAAAALCRAGVRSPWETRLRLFVLDLGLPEPLVTCSTSRRGWRSSSTVRVTGSGSSTAPTTSARRASSGAVWSSPGSTAWT